MQKCWNQNRALAAELVIAFLVYFIIKSENRRQNVISFYQPRVCRQQKWLRMGFELMPTLTRDVRWIEVAAILKRRTALSQLCVDSSTLAISIDTRILIWSRRHSRHLLNLTRKERIKKIIYKKYCFTTNTISFFQSSRICWCVFVYFVFWSFNKNLQIYLVIQNKSRNYIEKYFISKCSKIKSDTGSRSLQKQ